jgi:hypothetical protein
MSSGIHSLTRDQLTKIIDEWLGEYDPHTHGAADLANRLLVVFEAEETPGSSE